jgi:hypothetical protein
VAQWSGGGDGSWAQGGRRIRRMGCRWTERLAGPGWFAEPACLDGQRQSKGNWAREKGSRTKIGKGIEKRNPDQNLEEFRI